MIRAQEQTPGQQAARASKSSQQYVNFCLRSAPAQLYIRPIPADRSPVISHRDDFGADRRDALPILSHVGRNDSTAES